MYENEDDEEQKLERQKSEHYIPRLVRIIQGEIIEVGDGKEKGIVVWEIEPDIEDKTGGLREPEPEQVIEKLVKKYMKD